MKQKVSPKVAGKLAALIERHNEMVDLMNEILTELGLTGPEERMDLAKHEFLEALKARKAAKKK